MSEKRYQPLGQRALDTLLQDLPGIFAAFDDGKASVPSHADWLNWNVISRLAHEVAYWRARSPMITSGIRAHRIAQDAYDDEEFMDT